MQEKQVRIMEIIKTLAFSFNKEVSDEFVLKWIGALRHYPLENIEKFFEDYELYHRRFPLLGEVIEAMGTHRQQKKYEQCRLCDTTGMIVALDKEGSSMAFRCDCEKGRDLSSDILAWSDIDHSKYIRE